MTVGDILDALTPSDLVVPRRIVPFVYLTTFVTLALAGVIGFLSGYMLTDNQHSEERASILAEYADLVREKNLQIHTLTSQIIEMQKLSVDGSMRVEDRLSGLMLVIEKLSEVVSGNRKNTADLKKAISELRTLRQPRQAPRPPPPAQRPMIGPPPQSPLSPEKSAPAPTNLYRG